VIAYRDFVPEAVPRLPGRPAGPASFDSAVAAANRWIQSERVDVLGVETVVLPNIHSPFEMGTGDADLTATESSRWFQVVRVWYEKR